MKRRMILRLVVSLLFIAAFVVGATIIESGNSSEPMAWLSAQRHREVLWVVDAFALLTLLPVFGVASAQNRLAHKSEEISEGRAEHQKQLEKMLYNAGHMDRLNAEQTEEIIVLEQTIADLKAQLATMRSEALTRQQTPELETPSFAEQAFAALSGQVEANTRQMEAVNLAMQYQRAEMKNLRQGLRAIQRPHDIFDIARLTPSELTALEAEEPLRMLGHSEPDVQIMDHFKETKEIETEEIETEEIETEEIEEAVFFSPTMNAQSTFISPIAEFSVTSEFTADMNPEDTDTEQNDREKYGAEQNSAEDTANKESTSENKIVENKIETTLHQENIQTAAEKAEKKLERAWRLRL